MGLRCKRCGSEEHFKNGLMRTKQRYRCKSCGLNFTDTPPRGKPLALKATAVLLYVSGLSMNRTAKLLGVSTPTIQAWLERFAAAYAQKPEREGRGSENVTCAGLIERRTRGRTRLYCADDYAVYGVLLPVGQLYTGKEETHGIERDNARQRHWLARGRRGRIGGSKAKGMGGVSMALFAR